MNLLSDSGDPMCDASLLELARQVGEFLSTRELRIATAESCTGGMVAMALTAIAGSSGWLERGFVTYSNRSKTELLGVPQAILDVHGAVSEATARAMALGALQASPVEVTLAITGIAGPGGSVPGKPVGTVCFAWASCSIDSAAQDIDAHTVDVETCHFPGDRAAVRLVAARHALRGVLRHLSAA